MIVECVTASGLLAFDGERGVVLYARDSGSVERAVWRNLRLFMVDWQGNEARWAGVASRMGVVISEVRSATRQEALPVKGIKK